MSTNESFEWLNNDYIKLLLSKTGIEGSPELINFNISSGSAQGENFAGVIFRVTVNYTVDEKEQIVNLILKASPVAGAVAELLETLNVFDGESSIYQHILSDCDTLLPGFKMAPRLFYGDDKAMVLEDLTSSGFELANRKNRFDVRRAKLALAKLAKFHAVTASMYQNKPSLMERYTFSPHTSDEMTPLTFFLQASLQESLETIRNSDDLQKYVQLLESFDIVNEEKIVYSHNSKDRFKVLNHGDMWINNIFFKYDETKEPIDVLFVDFQESYFGSPGIDFNHFLYTSCNYDVHIHHIDELITFYYDNLIVALKQLKYEKIPTIDDIRYEIKVKAKQGLIALLSVVPVQMIEHPEHANPEYFLADTEEAQLVRREVYGNAQYVDILKVLLPQLDSRGVFGTAESHY